MGTKSREERHENEVGRMIVEYGEGRKIRRTCTRFYKHLTVLSPFFRGAFFFMEQLSLNLPQLSAHRGCCRCEVL